MDETPSATDATTETEPGAMAAPVDEAPVETVEELLVEEISIDGMCGVY